MSESPKTYPDAGDGSLAPALTMDSGGLITEWTEAAEAIFGWDRADAIGRKLSTLIIPERYRSMHEAGLKRFIGGGPGTVLNRAIEIAAIDRDGHEFTIEVHIMPHQTADGFRFATSVRKL